MLKKFLSVVVVILIIFTIVPLGVFAADSDDDYLRGCSISFGDGQFSSNHWGEYVDEKEIIIDTTIDLEMPNYFAQCELTPYTSDRDNASYKIYSGAVMVSDNTPYTVDMPSPDTLTFRVEVTAQNEQTRDYIVNVTRVAANNEGEAFNITLSGDVNSEGSYDIEFLSYRYQYNINVDNKQTVANFDVYPMDELTTYKIYYNGLMIANNESKTVDLLVGTNVIEVVLTSQTSKQKTYTYLIHRDDSDSLLDIDSLSAYSYMTPFYSDESSRHNHLEPFDKHNVNQSFIVPNSIQSITYGVYPSSDDATVVVKKGENTVSYVEGLGYQSNLDAGVNTFTFKVSHPDMSFTKTYTVTVTREAQNNINADLGNLRIFGSPVVGFDSNTITYDYYNSDSSSLTVTPIVKDSSATYQVLKDGALVGSNSETSVSLNASPLPTVITVVVTAGNGTTTKTYTVNVKRVSSTAVLKTLTLNNNSSQSDYPVTIQNGIYTYSVDTAYIDDTVYMSADFNRFKENSELVVYDSADQVLWDSSLGGDLWKTDLALNVGLNTYRLEVTAEDGVTKNNYTININRAASPEADDADINNVTLWLNDREVDFFTPNDYDYEFSVDNKIYPIELHYTLKNSNATSSVYLNGNLVAQYAAGAPGVGLNNLPLNEASNTLSVEVVAQDSVTTNTYTFIINRAASALQYIDIVKIPDKVDYVIGDTLDITGLSVRSNYESGYFEMLGKDDVSVSGFDSQTTGSQTITITYQSKTATFDVNVKTQPVTGVTLDKSTMSVKVGYTDILTATVSPPDAANKNVTWSSSDESVATVSNGVVTGVSVGNATIYATTYNGRYDYCDVNVELFVGTGTALDPFLIQSEEDLAMLATAVNRGDYSSSGDRYFKQTTDIDLSSYEDWVPIGSGVESFKDTYDGDGYKISNISITGYEHVRAGLFGKIISGTIKNVSMETGTIDLDDFNNKYVGSVVGDVYNSTIINCSSSTSIIQASPSNSYNGTGGIVGCLDNWSTISNCVYTGSITSGNTARTGGIVGVAGGSNQIINCKNYGDIRCEGAGDRSIGGIVGYCTSITIRGCSNFGDLSSDRMYQVQIGGIVGTGHSNSDVSILQCSNTGDISISSPDELNAGGIIGYISSGNISECYNSGNITVVSPRFPTYIGGIVGEDWGENTILGINDCFNVGNITCYSSNNVYMGGIIGHGESKIEGYTNCYNIGEISGNTNSSGGIAGWNRFAEAFSNCYYADTCDQGIGYGEGTVTSKTMTQLKQQASFSGFDFTNIWEIVESQRFPILQNVPFEYVTGVTVDETLSLEAGDTRTLTETVSPVDAIIKNVTWSSSDESVATVFGGVVTAIGGGTATITVTTEDGNYTDTCEVTVTQPVTGVSLDKSTTSVAVDGTDTLTATVSPADATNKNVTWSSDDESIATVADGVITGVSEGSATITVETEDGGFTDTCDVTVTPPVTGVSLNKSKVNLLVTETETLTATVTPSDALNKNVTWSSSNSGVATVSNGVVTAKSEGTAIITVTTEDGGYTDTCTVTITQPVTGVSLNKSTINLLIGETQTLTATIFPSEPTNKNVTWSTSNSSVATVSNGVVSAKSVGIATITVTTQDGGYRDTCTVKVSTPTVRYQTHVQNIGWQGWKYNGEAAGTSGQSLRLEGMYIEVEGIDNAIEYRTHVQNIGWQDWVGDGEMTGTSGRSLRLEAIDIRLTGELAEIYDIYYRVHAQNFGWMDWAKNGQSAGTAGYAYRLEAIEIVLVEKGGVAPGSTAMPFRDANGTTPINSPVEPPNDDVSVKYQTHVQNVGWQGWKSDGEVAGTSGRSLRLEGMYIELDGADGIEYRTHVQNIGWQDWVHDGEMSGTSGRSLRLEAIDIRLTGNMAIQYDIYYRVHAQNFGWMDWAKNGQSAGTAGFSYRLEAIEIVLVEKGGSTPGSTARPFVSAY